MKNLFFGTVSDFNINQENIEIVATDYTRYIIPIYSVSSIKFDKDSNIITFFPEVEIEEFTYIMSFKTSYTVANKIIYTIEKLKGEI